MENLVWVAFIGLLGGIAVGLQDPLASMMSAQLGTMESVFIIHFGGAVMSLIPLVFTRGGNLGEWQSVPWYALGAGILGVAFISAMSYAIPRIGVAPTVTLVVAGQLALGIILDHFGLLGAATRPLELSRLIGIGVVFLGVWLVIR